MTDVLELVEAGLSPPEAVDYYAVEVEGMTQTEWAERRDVTQASVSENVSKAKLKLGERKPTFAEAFDEAGSPFSRRDHREDR